MQQFVNPNPRIGVMLSQGGASVRLYNVLNPKFGMRGLNWLNKNWPEERLRRELPGYGNEISREWNSIISKRAVKPLVVDGFEFETPLDAALHLLWLLQRFSYYEKHREGQPCDGFRFREVIIASRKLLKTLKYKVGDLKRHNAALCRDSGNERGAQT